MVILVLPLLTFIYFNYNFGEPVDKVFLSISTFLYSIFTGFFISRQAARFNKVRESVTKFDGIMSGIYRSSGHISQEIQDDISEIIVGHYDKILQSEQWNYHFLNKSTTLTSMHQVLDDKVVDKDITKLSNQALGAVVKTLAAAQDVRKQMVAMYKERLPLEQWILIIFFASMLIGTVSVMPSTGVLFISILKAAFVLSVLSVLLILNKLNNLEFTERIMGEESANDVLGIISGIK